MRAIAKNTPPLKATQILKNFGLSLHRYVLAGTIPDTKASVQITKIKIIFRSCKVNDIIL